MPFPIAKQGFPFILIGLGGTIFFSWLDLPLAWGLAGLFTVFVTSFFRDPERKIPEGEKGVVAPADGRILLIEEGEGTPFSSDRAIKISIFMSVFNCHVNRIPFNGRIENIVYRPGRFIPANKGSASFDNEQNALLLVTERGETISFVQIAGLIARRIVCGVRIGKMVKKGDRFGLIQFGSRVDLYLPPSTQIRVSRGDKVKAGLTVMGELP